MAVDLSIGDFKFCVRAYGGLTNNNPGIHISSYVVRSAQSDYGPFCDHGKYLNKADLTTDFTLSSADIDFAPDSFLYRSIQPFFEEAKTMVMEKLALEKETSFDEYVEEIQIRSMKEPAYVESYRMLMDTLNRTALNLRNKHFLNVGCLITTRELEDLSTPKIVKKVTDTHKDRIISDGEMFQRTFGCS